MTNVKRLLLKNPIHLISFGFGIGLSRFAPGTLGTLLAVPLYLVLNSFSVINYIIVIIVLFVFGCWSSRKTADALGVHDHPSIVIDEIVGFLVAMIGIPTTWYWILLGFVLFRLFDIWKPWPISSADKEVRGGLGIMLDDLVAGFYSLLSLHLVIWSAQFI